MDQEDIRSKQPQQEYDFLDAQDLGALGLKLKQREPVPDAPARPKGKKRKLRWLWVLAAPALVGLFAAVREVVNRNYTPVPTEHVIWSGTGTQTEESQTPAPQTEQDGFYLAGAQAQVPIFDKDGNQTGTMTRGTLVRVALGKDVEVNGEVYYPLEDDDAVYLCQDNLAQEQGKAVLSFSIYVRTAQNLRVSPDSLELGTLVEKGETVQVTGCDWLYDDGTVHMYQVQYGDETGYLLPGYLTEDAEEARLPYDQTGLGAYHLGRGDMYGGGKAGNLDYYPRQKLVSETNSMPEHCYTLYLNSELDTVELIDEYIAFAKSTNINAFVVDIMDGSTVAYPSAVMDEYSPSASKNAINTQEEYGQVIRKLKDAGFYVIGRITAFNDYYFGIDHTECTIVDASGAPIELSGMYWPSAYSRYAWEYKAALAKEAVELFGFNEIQYDYVRFPDGTFSYDSDGNIDYHNEYGETKAQAIQRFLMYACDVLHEEDVYVSADVFGETSNAYVASYGQYFPAISNVVDVISGMPYPDHYEQSGDYRPWEHPYDTVDNWAEGVVVRQSETPTPAIVRTWIQAYDAIQYPYNSYGPAEVGQEITALMDNGLTGGFITWNADSSYSKYQSLKETFDALA